ncbi:SixA phosphatase family protein [Schleiferia thermophila]|jgi:phosphohistidine phosphatase|uniref:Phosphohistidine phosphatase n=1 Tax=Schleiferia thermophila TaxID=884107 RepID=A0A369A1Y4_9FLAO|nr:histidine phosphatase family protein [Schleiferia thermophila]KFD39292.1 phosphoglycerate mutase [Schleiferia thermophila str. Yellowstone]RCX03195.1 phosphohistidine phosphatase [Schleiferia thermophila]GCD80324.1 phosphohistidine phosphatase SixA [Schleiferia thermophila]
MKTLYLIRHAKSSWDFDNIPDLDRPLNGRGVNDAYESSKYLRVNGDIPELIISSPATRALHTAMIFARQFGIPFSMIQIDPMLYDAPAEQIANVIKKVSNEYQKIMVFAHNPGITEFVNHAINHHIDNVPTTGIACLVYPIDDWKNINTKAELRFFDYPKKRRKQ